MYLEIVCISKKYVSRKKYLEILVDFIVLQCLLMIRLLRLGSSVHYFENVIKQETHIFTRMIINN
jgi:hypothetical protein